MEHLIVLQYCYNYLIDQISIGLLLYSHIPTAVAGLILGVFLLFQSRKLPNVTLFLASLFFAIWCFLDLGSWFAFLGSGVMMTTWSLADLFSPLFFAFSYYFFYSFITGGDIPAWQKVAGTLLILPNAFWILAGQKLTTYDANSCEAYENTFHNYYQFAIEGLFLLAIILAAVVLYRKSKDALQKRQIVLTATGLFFFLGFFLTSTLGVNFLVSDAAVQFAYNYEIYGLFGMPIFLAYLGYIIVRYHSFNLKIFGAQALILALVALIGAEFAFASSLATQILIAVTLVVTGWAGILLIRGVRREVEQRERIEKLAKELEETNGRQESLIHFVGHEVKGYLTKDMSAFAALAEGDFGLLPDGMKPFVENALASSREGARSVIDILQASNQKKGTVEYKKEPFDLAALTREWFEKDKSVAEKKGLTYTLDINEAGTPYTVIGDGTQTGDHVLRNLIENAVNYTPQGSITVSLHKQNGKAVFAVKDSGVGITPEDKARLFTEGGRGKDSIKVNAHSTGYGLFIAKNIVEAQGGTIRAESEGPGKGSTFVAEFPVA